MLCLWSGLKPTCAPASLSEQTHLGPAGRDSGCRDLSAGYWKSSLVTIQFSAAGPHRFSCDPGGAKPEYQHLQSDDHNSVGGGDGLLDVTRGSFLTGGARASGEAPPRGSVPAPGRDAGINMWPLLLPSNAVGLSVHSAGHFSLTPVL